MKGFASLGWNWDEGGLTSRMKPGWSLATQGELQRLSWKSICRIVECINVFGGRFPKWLSVSMFWYVACSFFECTSVFRRLIFEIVECISVFANPARQRKSNDFLLKLIVLVIAHGTWGEKWQFRMIRMIHPNHPKVWLNRDEIHPGALYSLHNAGESSALACWWVCANQWS